MLKQKKIFSSLLILCLFSQFAIAGDNLSDWNNVRILETGTAIVVKTKAGEKYECVLKSTTSDSLTIVLNSGQATRKLIDLRKDEVKEVRRKLSRVTSTLIGTGIGTGIGIALGDPLDAKDKYGEDPGLAKAVFGFLGMVFGTAVGTRLRFTGKRVYQAK
jgi:hypothetical protein